MFSDKKDSGILYKLSKLNEKIYDEYLDELKSLSYIEKATTEKYRQLVNLTAAAWIRYFRSDEEFKTAGLKWDLQYSYTSSYTKKHWFFPEYPKNCTTETLSRAAKDEETARGQDGGAGRTPAKQAPTALACDALGGEWHGGTLAKVRQIATAWKKVLSSRYYSPYDRRIIIGEHSNAAYMETLMIWQCHATFVMLSKKGSDEDRKLAREEGCAIEKTLEKMAEQIKATGYFTAGASWKPYHIAMSEKWELKDLCDTGKIEKAGSGSGKEPKRDAPPVAEARPKKDCKSGGGLAGAMNCVTKRIEGAGGSNKKPAGKPPNPASSTGKNGNVPSGENAGKPPAWASSTDPKTGVTIKSVANPDGSRTVTTTDRDGVVLSRERVR